MGCLGGITAAITNSCESQPKRGLAVKAWAMNRADIDSYTEDVSNPNLITGITLAAGGKQAWVLTSYRTDIDAGSDLVVNENLPEAYTHYFKLEPWDEDSDQINNLDNMEDIVVIVERNGNKTKSSGDGAFQIYGLKNGLYKSSMSKRANDNNGVPVYEFASREGQEEEHSVDVFFDTDYATSLAALVALETPTA